ncbi:hypothetical protein D9758_008606 [Tetrapyrgos nigripes]|uniref:Uncharacterized protein n=1 Tax=Tetrapyrgos nigripes TaxID=182062 RepID=A0A8H5D7M1_9AGAR|nr:hypothetical protein D9758_008606 [Tetrapyrgos nigripes]
MLPPSTIASASLLHDRLGRSSLDLVSDTNQQIQIGIRTITDTTHKFLQNAEVESAFWGEGWTRTLHAYRSDADQCNWHLRQDVMLFFSSWRYIYNGRIIFGVTCLLFISSTSLWAMDLALNNELTSIALDIYDPSASPEEWLLSVEAKIHQVTNKTNSLMIISDAVVIWRTYAIWGRKRTIISLPILILLAALGCAIVQLFVCDLQLLKHGSTMIRICIDNMRMPMFITFILSLFTNFTSTSLIAVRAWSLRGFMKQSLGANSPSTRVQRILGLLVESGLIYFVFMSASCFIGNAGIIAPHLSVRSLSTLAFAASAFAGMINQLMGIYPTSIIVLVSLGQTFTEISTCHTSGGGPISQLRFANGSTRSNMTWDSANDLESSVDGVPRVPGQDYGHGYLDMTRSTFRCSYHFEVASDSYHLLHNTSTVESVTRLILDVRTNISATFSSNGAGTCQQIISFSIILFAMRIFSFFKALKKLRRSPFKRKKPKAAVVTDPPASSSRGPETNTLSPEGGVGLQVDGGRIVQDGMMPILPCRCAFSCHGFSIIVNIYLTLYLITALSSDETSSLEDTGHRHTFTFRRRGLFYSSRTAGPVVSSSRKARRLSAKKIDASRYTSSIPSPTPSDTSTLCPDCLRLSQAWNASATGHGAKSHNMYDPRHGRRYHTCTTADENIKSPGLTEEKEKEMQTPIHRNKEMDEKRLQELNRLRRHCEFLKQGQLHLQEAARTMLELLHRPVVSA